MGVPAQGQILSLQANTGLYSVLGVRFGGNGQTTFALPDLTGLAPNGLTYMICVEGLLPTRE